MDGPVYDRIGRGETPTDGYGSEWSTEERRRIQRQYRQGFPRNPYLHHRYWVAEARAAWAADQKEVIGLCGEPMELDYDPDGPQETGGTAASCSSRPKPGRTRSTRTEDGLVVDEDGLR